MPISADWQGNLRALTFGAGTDWEIEPPGIGGLGIPTARTSDAERGDRHGDVGGSDRLPRRILSIPLVTTRTSPGAAWLALEQEAKVAFAESSADLELDLRLPAVPETDPVVRRFYGRARGLSEDLSLLKSSTVRVLGTFEALDPLGYGDEISSDVEAPGTFTVDNIGTASSDRVVLHFVGSGGIPVLTNADDDGLAVIFGEALGAGEERIVDLRAATVVDLAGDDFYGELSPVNQWTELRPGENELTLAGATSVVVTFRPAYR